MNRFDCGAGGRYCCHACWRAWRAHCTMPTTIKSSRSSPRIGMERGAIASRWSLSRRTAVSRSTIDWLCRPGHKGVPIAALASLTRLFDRDGIGLRCWRPDVASRCQTTLRARLAPFSAHVKLRQTASGSA